MIESSNLSIRTLFFFVKNDHRRLSDGPYPQSLRLPQNHLNYPETFLNNECSPTKEKNSSLTTLLDSTSSIMKTASSTFQTLIGGSNRRASYCGEPDPTVQLSANGQIGSLYIINRTSANSTDSFMSNNSIDEQKRTVTIYDGRIPSAPTAPTIPFELMTPIDAITQTIEDPVESFVQIVLEEPDERPPVIRRLSTSSPSPRRRRSLSPRNCQQESSSNLASCSSSTDKLAENDTAKLTQLLNTLEIHCQPPEVVEPMDFSFLEPVLRGETTPVPINSVQIAQATNSSSHDHIAINNERLKLPSIE